MRAPSYDKMSKKALIDRLIEAERQLRTVAADKGPVSAPAARRRAGKQSGSEERPNAATVRKEEKRVRPARPAGAEIKSASESDYTILDRDGRIRRLYKVVKDIRDDAGEPVFSEGALYEVTAQPSTQGDLSGSEHPDDPDGTDQTELICRFRPNGTLTYVNEAYCRYFGCDRDDLHDRNILLSISEADREDVYSRLKGLRPERPVDTLEYHVLTAFGDILWNQWTYRALFDDSGNILEYQSVGRDITFRKYTQDVLEKRAAILEAVTYAAESFLKSSSWRDRIERVLERFGAALNASHVFLCENRIGAQGDIAVLRSYEWLSPQIKSDGNRKKFLQNSKLAVHFSRWVYEKSEGRPIYGTIGQFPVQDVGDLALDKKMSIAIMPVLMGERWWGFIGFADYSGEIQWTEEEIAPLGAASEILGAAIEREEKEQALRETHETIRDQERFLAGVFDGIQDGLTVLAPDLTILRVNTTIEKRFPHVRPITGRKCYEAYYGRKHPCKDCPCVKTLKTGKPSTWSRSIVGPDGEPRGWVEIFSYPWIDDRTGELKGVIEYSRDITKRRQAEEELANTRTLLEQAFEQSPYPMALVSMPDMVVRIANPSIREFLGIMDDPNPVGQSLFEMKMSWKDCDLQGNPYPLEELPLPRALRGQSTLNQEVMAVRKDGTVRHELVSGVPIHNDKGEILAGYLVCTDITERKQAEESLRISEARYRELADTIPAGVYEATVDGYFTYANRTAMGMFGYGEDDIRQGIHFLQVVAPEDHDIAKRRSQAVREDEPLPYTDYTFVRKNGSRFPGLLMSKPVKQNGQVVGSTGVVTDISELKDAQSALRKNEAMLQSILKAVPVGIAFGRERTLQWSNEYYRRMTGYGEDDVSGRTARLLYESEEEFQRVGKALYGSIGKDGIRETQTRWKRLDGSVIDVLLSVNPLYPDDAAQGVVISALDVTEKKKAEEALRASETRYRELADNMPAGIYEATLDGIVQYANNTALEMFGYSADEVANGVNFLAVISPDERDTLIRHMQKIRQEGATSYQEYNMVRKDGSRFAALNMARPLMHKGQVIGSTGIVTDISELKAAQEALRKNEALLKSIVRAAPIGVGIVHDRVIGWVNEGMTVLTGYSSDELRGKGARLVYPDDEEFERAGREKYAEIAARGKGAVETRWRRKDGSIIDVHLSSAPIDPANLAAGVVFTALDITAQKKAARILLFAKEDLEKQVTEQTQELDVANMLLRLELEEHRKTEEALVNSEQLYRAIVEDQTEIICRFRPDGTISFVNEAFCRYFGNTRDEILGKRYLPSISKEDRRNLWTAYGSLTQHHPVFHMEFRIEMPDGAVRWLHWTNRAIYDESGSLVEHQGVCRDITERKHSEQQIRESRNMLRSVFDGISDPLIMIREDMTLIMLNRAALGFFGSAQYREMIGTSCLEPFEHRYGREASTLVQSATTGEGPARFELASSGDSARYEEVFVYPVHAGGGDLSMAIIRITDRTKQRLMERELIQSEKLASLGLLISGIVHEINNPNNFISFNIPILRDYLRDILPVLDEHAASTPHFEVQGMPYAEFRTDVMKLLENIEHGSTRINTTVAKLKEFSRKKDEKGARPILPTGVVERAVAICHTQIRKTVKTFSVQVEQDMPEMVSDPDAIEQTLINLLINAAQAADKPDSSIRLSAWRGASGREGFVLEVEDNGCGMDARTASRIFDPFFTTKEEGMGTGLGLYISKNLLESVGGAISVQSEIGRGATFRVVIPDLGDPDHSKKPSEQKGVGA